MLIYSESRFVPTDVNMLVIRSKNNDGYFYIHRALYDQAVIINDIYGEDTTMLIKALTGEEASRGDVDRFIEEAPAPISIFGPFLLLVKEELTEFEDMVGAIHVMSGPLHLRNILKVPFEMRNMPTFSLSIKEEYQLAWDRFFQTVLPYTPDMFRMPTVTPMNGVQTTTVEQEPEELTGYEDVGLDQTAMDFLFGDDDPFADDDEEEEEPTTASPVTQSEITIATATPEPVAEPEPVVELAKEPAKPMSLVDRMISLA